MYTVCHPKANCARSTFSTTSLKRHIKKENEVKEEGIQNQISDERRKNRNRQTNKQKSGEVHARVESIFKKEKGAR